jgi:hypothetical protein
MSRELRKVKDWTLSGMEEEPTRSFSVRRAGNVGAPATLNSLAHTIGTKKRKKKIDVSRPGST